MATLPAKVDDDDFVLPLGHEYDLTPQQGRFAYWRSFGMTPTQAAKRAGYTRPSEALRTLESIPKVRELIKRLANEARVRYDVDRDRVVEGLMEALNVAREQSDARTMIQAWSELARITGVQAPEVKRVELVGEVTQHHLMTVSDKELLAMVGKDRELDALEGEYEDVKEDSET